MTSSFKTIAFAALLAVAAVVPAAATVQGTPLHGYCGGAGQCVDNGTNSPTTTNPPSNFGFTIGGGPTAGTLVVDILVPNNEASPSTFGITGTLAGTATLFSASAWTTGQLDLYLGISASPANPIGAYLPSTQGLDPGATGFFVYQANLGTATLQSPGNPDVSPLENLNAALPLGSYIVGFLSNANGGWDATANSGAIFETHSGGGTGGGQNGVPEPASLALLGVALTALGVAKRRRRV